MSITFKPKIVFTEPNKEGKYNIKIRCSCNGETRYIKTLHWIDKEFFDNDTGKVKLKHPNCKIINLELQNKILKLEKKIIGIDPGIKVKDLLVILKKKKNDKDIFDFAAGYIEKFELQGRKSYADQFRYTMIILSDYTKTKSLFFKQIDLKFLQDFETYLIQKGLKTNSISYYIRTIRTIYNYAINEGIASLKNYPFRKFKIKAEKTRKRNVPMQTITAIKKIELSQKKAYARDMFLLSFYLIGINFKDLYYASGLKNGRLEYSRAKTKRLYSIEVLPPAMKIIERYRGQTLLLNCSEIYSSVYNFRKSVNKFLNDICLDMDLNVKITTYYARHSWATIASKLGVDRDTISHALGHGLDGMTDIYIDFDMDRVDNANKKVIAAIG